MVVRRGRKAPKRRGNRTHGKGNTKNKRGTGCVGGTGRAGSHKHKFTKYYMTFGIKQTLKPRWRAEAINLDDLQRNLQKWLAEKKVEKQATGYVIDGRKLGFGKILSRGFVKEKLVLKNLDVSEKAKGKIAAAGGSIQVAEKMAASQGSEKAAAKQRFSPGFLVKQSSTRPREAAASQGSEKAATSQGADKK